MNEAEFNVEIDFPFPATATVRLTYADRVAIGLACKVGHKVDGIRYIRARFGYSLRDAKSLLDAYAASMGLPL
jgi:hypothetical protein